MITEIYEFWFFLVQKWPLRDAYLLFKKEGPETPIFIVFFLVRAFWAKVSKKGNFWKATTKNGKIWLITEKLFLGIFAVFFLLLFFFFFPLFFLCFFEGLRVRSGHLTWPWTLLIYFFLFLFVFFCFFCFFCFFFLFFLFFFWKV